MKIGYLDHDLNHSHATTFLKLTRQLLGPRGVEVACAYETHPVGDDWCAANGVRKAASLAAVIEDSDAIMILAPDNIAEHRQLFEQTAAALKKPKPVYIDKYLHTRLQDARTMVSLAQEKKIPIAGSSALRFAPELEAMLPEMTDVLTCTVRGYGPIWQYAVHTLAIGLRIIGSGFTRVINTGTEQEAVITADFGGRKMFAQVVMSDNSYQIFPWTFSAFRRREKMPDSCGFICVSGAVSAGSFENLIRAVGQFFATGIPYLTAEEMLDTVALLERAEESRQAGGVWLSAG